MFKKILCLSVLLVSACRGQYWESEEFAYTCPNVSIASFYNRVTKMSAKGVIYEAELVGYEGYCHPSGRKGQADAVISPIFEISRLAPTYNNAISVRYYADTTDNGENSMGKHYQSATAEIAKEGEKVLYKGEEMHIAIPETMPGYKIKLGIVLSKDEYKENLKMGLGAK